MSPIFLRRAGILKRYYSGYIKLQNNFCQPKYGQQRVGLSRRKRPLGRLASEVAILLRGKHKPNFTPHVDCGDNVIITNAEKVTLTGNKSTEKRYIRYTGYPGGQRSLTATEIS